MRENAFSCDACGELGRPSAPRTPPEGWTLVAIRQVGEDSPDRFVVCSQPCLVKIAERRI